MTLSEDQLVADFEHLMTGAPIDEAEIYRRCRDRGAFWSERVDGWVVTRYADVAEVLRNEDGYPPLLNGPGTTAVYGRTVLQMIGAEHRRKIAPLARRLRNPSRLQDEIAAIVSDTLQESLRQLDFSQPVELRTQLFSRFPMTVIARLMGLEEAAGFRELYGDVVAAATSNMQGDPDIAARGDRARRAIYEMLGPEVERRRQTPCDDLISELCTMEFEGLPLPDGELLAYALFLFVGGVETTERTLTNAFQLLARDADLWTRVQSDRSLVLPFLAETLRYAPPVHALTRGTSGSSAFDGVRVPSGSKVLTVLASANRDPEIFSEPETFVLARFEEDAHREFTAAGRTLAFGAGPHHCTGSLLARMEMEAVVNALLDRHDRLQFRDQADAPTGYVLRAPAELWVKSATAVDSFNC